MKQIMKTVCCLMAVGAALAVATSCTKEILPENRQCIVGVERHISASAQLPGSSADKAYLDAATSKVVWQPNDWLNINGTNIPLSGVAAPDSTSAIFDGFANAIPVGGSEVYWAVYPAALAGTSSGSSIHADFQQASLTVHFPDTQYYSTAVSTLQGGTCMAGYASVAAGTTDVIFQMRNLGAVLKLRLTPYSGTPNKHVNRIEISTTNGALAGDFTVNNNSSAPTVAACSTATRTLTVNLSDGANNYVDISGGADVYVLVPPMTGNDLTMKIYNTNGGYTLKTASSTNLARNHIYTTSVSDICFCEGDTAFSVSSTKKVVFAPGNLQWSATGGGRWRFALNPWDTTGANNANISSSYTGWIDLFGWGTSGYHYTSDQDNRNYYPYSISSSTVRDPYNYYGYGPSTYMDDCNLTGTSANYDWGVYNAIYNPSTGNTDPAGTWRTPTKNEWNYLLSSRYTCCGIRYAKARVNGVNGLVIVPDNWDANIYNLRNTNIQDGAPYTSNNLSSTQWTILKNAGCAFLPAAGWRTSRTVNDVGSYGHYWSATYGQDEHAKNACSLGFSNELVAPITNYVRYVGYSVRLVKDVQ